MSDDDGQTIYTRESASIRPRATLEAIKYPKCAHCFAVGKVTPNPLGLTNCPRCGGLMRKTDRLVAGGVFKAPLLARICYAIADWLVRLHDRL